VPTEWLRKCWHQSLINTGSKPAPRPARSG
jgi:hypothetical protein